jgi:exodeoxyribonuclease VII large subunit
LEHISLFELNEYLRRVVALNFPESLWIRAEISQLNQRKGHIFLDLIEKDEIGNDIIAKSSAVIWMRNLRILLQKYGKSLESILQEGIEVLLKVSVNYDERYGMSLNIEDVDLTFTLGKFAILRQKTLEYLEKKKILTLQKKLNLPYLVQRIAVISSSSAAGWIDFYEHLKKNQYGYTFHLQLFETSVQGQFAVDEIKHQLKKIKILSEQKPYDAVVIIRGGGSKIDLAVFDDQSLNEAVALFPIPILAGIGHEIDQSVLDITAHVSLKTPTAVADFLISQHLHLESRLVDFSSFLIQKNKEKINIWQQQLNRSESQLHNTIQLRLAREHQNLDYKKTALTQLLHFKINAFRSTFIFLEKSIQNADPEQIMKKGFSITLKNGKLLKDKNDLQKDDEIETIFSNGRVKSKVQ